MGDNKSLEPLFNDDLSDEASETGKRDLRFKNALNPLDGYRMSDTEINMGTTVVNYYGFLNKDGAWYIQEQTVNGIITAWRYAKDDTGYNFGGRSGLSYDTFDAIF